jgi:hypothetical protein
MERSAKSVIRMGLEDDKAGDHKVEVGRPS